MVGRDGGGRAERAEAGIDTGRTCFLVHEALSARECAEVLARAREAGFSPMRADYPGGYRNNDRLVMDSPELASTLFARLRAWLPEELEAAGSRWRLVGLNERFRFCRYEGGQSFCIHRDGAHAPRERVRSHLTVMTYLDDAAGFTGGRTRFYAERTADSRFLGAVTPRAGTMIVFDHALWHDGEPVTAGVKHVMRTDVLYERLDAPARDGHSGYVWALAALSDGRLASGSRDRTVRLWREGRVVEVLEGHEASVTCLVEAAPGAVWSGSRDRTVRRWVGRRAELVAEHEGAVLTLARVGGAIALGDATGAVSLRSAEGTSLASWHAHDGWVWALAAMDDSLLSGGEDGAIHRWNAAGRSLRTNDAGAPVRALSVRDGRVFAGLADGHVVELDGALRELRRWRAHAGSVNAVLATGTLVWTGGEDDQVHAWRGPERVRSFAHGDFVRALAELPGGRVASGGYDGEVRLLG